MILHKRFVKGVAVLAASTVMCMNVSVLEAKDYKGHWAQEAISEWVSLGIIKGYEDGTIRPSQPVTRAELASLLSRVFQLNYKDTSISYEDVKEGTWYHEAVTLVMSAEIMNDYEGEFRPNQMATREEAAYAFAHAYHLAGGDAKTFIDSELISDWAKEEVEALIAGGYLQGRTDGTLAPKDTLTRAEFITMLDKLTAKLYQDPGTYSGNISGNVVINTADITLKDMTISGNLYIAEGVGEGDVTLDNVKIEGVMIVEGGGEHSVEVIKSTLNTIYVEKASGAVRVALDDSSKAAKVKVNSKAQLEGSIEYVEVATREEINLVGTTIKNLQIAAADGNIKVDKTSVIDQLVADAQATIVGSGKVSKAFINADRVVIEGLKLAKDAITISDDVKVSPVINTTSGQTSGGGGGGGSTTGSDKNESTESGKDESTDSGKDESTDSGKDESTDSGEDESTDSGEDESTESGKDESTDSGEDESTESGEDESTESGEDESTESGKDESTESGKDESTESGKDESTESGKDESTESGKDESTESGKDESTESGKDESTESGEDESTVSVESIKLSQENLDLLLGEETHLTAEVFPIEATNKDIIWTSDRPDIVSVDAHGRLSTNGIGEAIITASTLNGEVKASCKVSVEGYVLSGKVTVEESNQAGIQVLLYAGKSDSEEPVASVVTDASGEYEFSDLPKGNYRIKAFYEDETSEYIAPISEVSMEEASKKVDINCEKVTSFTVKAVDLETNQEILYVHILVEGQDEDGNKWSYKKETNGAGEAKFTLPNDIDSQVTYTLKKEGYEEITLNYNLKLLEKNTLVVPFKKEVEPIYPEKIEQYLEKEGTNQLGVGDTTYEALKRAGWRVESETKLSTNSRRLIFENMNGKDGIDAKIIYNRSGFEDEIKDYDVLLQYMIRKQTEDTKGDWSFEELKQVIENGSGPHIDGHRTIKVTYDGKVDGIVEIVFSNYN